MSYNIRGDQASDGVNQWIYRRDRVVDLLKSSNPALLGLQEARPAQLQYIEENLEDYQRIGSGGRPGEFTVILYNTNDVELVDGSEQILWLSETPDQPGTGWDAALQRYLILAKFRDLNSGDIFLVLNTHFDHQGETAREESAKLVVNKIREIENNGPVILMGDFNFTEDSIPYYIITAPDTGLENAFYISEVPHVGPVTRSAGFEVRRHSDLKPIDFIFVNEKVKVKTHAFLINSTNGYYPSDHLPVVAEVEL